MLPIVSVVPKQAAVGKAAWGNGAQLALCNSVSLLVRGAEAESLRFRRSLPSELTSRVRRKSGAFDRSAAASARAGLVPAGEAGFCESGIQDSGLGTQCQLSESQTDVSSFSSA